MIMRMLLIKENCKYNLPPKTKDDKHLPIMIQAAEEAGHVLLKGYNSETVSAKSKSANLSDLVTEYDLRSEKLIIEKLKKAFPEYAVIAEESSNDIAKEVINREHVWVIDPLDGTTNFTYKRPHFAISIGLLHKGVPVAGVVYNPAINELFFASKGKGAYCNNRKISVGSKITIEGSLVHLGIHRLANVQLLEKLTNRIASLLRFGGSAAVDLAYVAMGRIDAQIFVNLKPWDIAAGMVLVQEAGGVVMEPDGGNNCLSSGHIMAGNVKLLQAIMELLSPGVKVDNVQFGKLIP